MTQKAIYKHKTSGDLFAIETDDQGYEVGEYKGKKRGNFLPMPWTKDSENDLSFCFAKAMVINQK